MNRRHTSRLQKLLRAAALTLALICLGVSGGTTLIHTDEMSLLQHSHAGTSAIVHAGAAGDADNCPACQWENSLFSPQVPAVPIPHLPLLPLARLVSPMQTCFPNPFDHTSPRAPPRFLS